MRMSVWKSRGMTDCLEFIEAWRWRKKENDKGKSRDIQIKGKRDAERRRQLNRKVERQKEG